MLGNKRINVLYTNPDGKNLDKKEIMVCKYSQFLIYDTEKMFY